MNLKYRNNRGITKLVVLACFGLMLFTASCKKFTEIQPLDALAESTAFSDKASIELAMNGVYQQAAVGTYAGGGGRGYPFGSAAIQQAEMRGEDMINLATFYQITYQATQSTASANNVNHYENLYNLINQANIVIEGVRAAGASGILTAAEANSYEGEARFLRALSHHELVINFSRPFADGNGSQPGIPYREVAISNTAAFEEAANIGRGTVAEVYTKILADLDFAEANLNPATDLSRANKGAAIALKTRINLHKGDWAAVIAEGTKLGASGSAPFTSSVSSYRLTDAPDGPFVNNRSNTESIFSIANSAASNGEVNGALAPMLLPAEEGGRTLISTSPNLYNASFWVEGDLRKSTLQIADARGVMFNYKYRDATTKTDWAPIIRYAEVLLNVAEANARAGQSTQAFALLNAVRNRSVPAANQFAAAPADLIRAILNERRVEFAGEGRRWPDIHRLAVDPTYNVGGIPAKLNPTQVTGASFDGSTIITPARAAIPYDSFRFLWPFPLSEVNANPLIAGQQNPGY
jgi:hypothetical protein